jgi:hypothetical protein
MPGMAQIAPPQRLIREWAIRNPDRSDRQVETAMDFVDRLNKAGAAYFANSQAGARLEAMRRLNRTYLAHEFLNENWNPLYHADVAREMAAARLTYVASATIPENIDATSCLPSLHPLLADAKDKTWRETLLDFAANKQFRRDIYLRGATPIRSGDLVAVFGKQRFVATASRRSMTFKFKTPVGEVSGQQDIYAPIADALAARPHTLIELSNLPSLAGQGPVKILQALSLLVHAGSVHPEVSAPQDQNTEAARRFNRAMAARIHAGDHYTALAAPAVGTAVGASYAETVGLLARLEDPNANAQQAARFGWSIMARTGQRLLKDDVAIASERETMPELESQIEEFFTQKLPIWRALGVA